MASDRQYQTFQVWGITRMEIANELNGITGANFTPDDERLTDEICEEFADKLATRLCDQDLKEEVDHQGPAREIAQEYFGYDPDEED